MAFPGKYEQSKQYFIHTKNQIAVLISINKDIYRIIAIK